MSRTLLVLALISTLAFTGVNLEDEEEVNLPLSGLCIENIDSTLKVGGLMPLVCEESVIEPTGGVVEDEEEHIEPLQTSTGTLVELSSQKVIDLPEWVILTPIVCPAYTQKYHSYHKGVDLVNRNCNSDWVVAAQKGFVTFVGRYSGYGNRIEIDHGNGFVTSYSHLSAFGIEVGDEVILGQKIGTLGSTGNSTGVHLHFEIIYNGVKIDPDLYLKI